LGSRYLCRMLAHLFAFAFVQLVGVNAFILQVLVIVVCKT